MKPTTSTTVSICQLVRIVTIMTYSHEMSVLHVITSLPKMEVSKSQLYKLERSSTVCCCFFAGSM